MENGIKAHSKSSYAVLCLSLEHLKQKCQPHLGALNTLLVLWFVLFFKIVYFQRGNLYSRTPVPLRLHIINMDPWTRKSSSPMRNTRLQLFNSQSEWQVPHRDTQPNHPPSAPGLEDDVTPAWGCLLSASMWRGQWPFFPTRRDVQSYVHMPQVLDWVK